MRNLGFYALGLALLCALAAAPANATSQMNITYLGGSSLSGETGGTSVAADVGDTLSFSLNVQVDAAGLSSVGFDLQWSDNADVNESSATWETGVVFTSFTPVTSTTLLTPTPTVDLGGTGQIGNFGFFGLPPFPTSTNVFLGNITFDVSTSNEALLALGFFRTDGSSATDGAAVFITPDFTSFSVNAPAPGASLSLFAGLATLSALSLRRGRRKD